MIVLPEAPSMSWDFHKAFLCEITVFLCVITFLVPFCHILRKNLWLTQLYNLHHSNQKFPYAHECVWCSQYIHRQLARQPEGMASQQQHLSNLAALTDWHDKSTPIYIKMLSPLARGQWQEAQRIDYISQESYILVKYKGSPLCSVRKTLVPHSI